MDKRKKLQNFWFYYKKHLLTGLAVVMVLAYLGIQKITTVKPDYHIGLVRASACTDGMLQELEDLFTSAGTDVNGDGQVLVQIHTYYVDLADQDENAGVSNAEVVQALDADLIGGMSGIFLLEDAETFRRVTGDILSGSVIAVDNGLYLTIRRDAAAAYTTLAEKIP